MKPPIGRAEETAPTPWLDLVAAAIEARLSLGGYALMASEVNPWTRSRLVNANKKIVGTEAIT